MSPVCQISSAVSRSLPPALTYCSSGNPEPSPAVFCTKTSCPAPTSACTPAGVKPTRYSLSLISFGKPIFIVVSQQLITNQIFYRPNGHFRNAQLLHGGDHRSDLTVRE